MPATIGVASGLVSAEEEEEEEGKNSGKEEWRKVARVAGWPVFESNARAVDEGSAVDLIWTTHEKRPKRTGR